MRVVAGRYRVNAALVPWVALSEATDGHVAALHNAMSFNRVHRVGGTTGIKTAMVAQQWADAGLIDGKDKYQ